MKRLLRSLLLGFPFLLGLTPFAKAQKTSAYDVMLAAMYKNTVPVLTPADLAEKLKAQPSNIVLLDTRAPAEYKVSHLANAVLVDYDKVKDKELGRLPKDKILVVYCSVGYRSERIGERLKTLGYPQVYNLYGGIFQWVNQGLPVVDAQGKTQKVHAYSRKWGIWLNKGEKVYD